MENKHIIVEKIHAVAPISEQDSTMAIVIILF